MKRNFLFIVAVVSFATANLSVSAQGIFQKIVKPDAVGGSFVGCRQDAETRYSPGQGFGLGGEIFVKYNLSPSIFFTVGTGIITATDKIFGVDKNQVQLFPMAGAKVGYNLFRANKLAPYINIGLMGFRSIYKTKSASDKNLGYDPAILGGGGLEYAINEKWSVNAGFDAAYAFMSSVNKGEKKPLFWTAKAGLTYSLKHGNKNKKKEEIEYPLGKGDLALDDLFKEDTTGTESNKDALAKLFEPEKGGSKNPQPSTETKTTYSNSEVGQLMAKIQNLKDEMEQRMNQIEELQAKVESNEKAIAEISRNVAGEYAGYSRGSFGVLSAREFKQRYEAALQKFYARQYKEAIRDFTQLMTSNPDNRLASNCQYWIGESYNALRQYRKAINAFNAVLRYRASYKFDDALLMSGLCHLKIGDKSTAREEFQQLVSRFPDSEYAPKAMRYLGRL